MAFLLRIKMYIICNVVDGFAVSAALSEVCALSSIVVVIVVTLPTLPFCVTGLFSTGHRQLGQVPEDHLRRKTFADC